MNNRDSARLIIPDIHHKAGLVDRIRDNHPAAPAIFLGDYFDDFYDSTADMEVTCRWLKQAIAREQDTFLLGNHCFAYLSYELGGRWGYCSGWTVAKQQVFHQHFPGDTLLKCCAWLTRCRGWVITHAGITRKLYRGFSNAIASRRSFDGSTLRNAHGRPVCRTLHSSRVRIEADQLARAAFSGATGTLSNQ